MPELAPSAPQGSLVATAVERCRPQGWPERADELGQKELAHGRVDESHLPLPDSLGYKLCTLEVRNLEVLGLGHGLRPAPGCRGRRKAGRGPQQQRGLQPPERVGAALGVGDARAEGQVVALAGLLRDDDHATEDSIQQLPQALGAVPRLAGALEQRPGDTHEQAHDVPSRDQERLESLRKGHRVGGIEPRWCLDGAHRATLLLGVLRLARHVIAWIGGRWRC
mmetsp:Transcript_21539/g.62393  ORF Transcript_21539/g.62393 Transcript_21539/m.62393 type:complete len:223 (-) Transcript_21539:2013-2681(-)